MSVRLPASRRARAALTAPAILSATTIAGLVAGLVGDGMWDVGAWLLLGLLPLVLVIAWSRRSR